MNEFSKKPGDTSSGMNFEDIVEQAPDPMVALDRFGFVRYINSAAEKVSGYAREEITGKHFAELGVIAPDSLARAVKEFAATISGSPGPSFHMNFVRKDGTKFTVDVNGKPIMRRGEIIGISLIMRYFGEKK